MSNKPMSIYVWEVAAGVTGNYHNGGGVVVVAPDLESARALLPEDCSARTEDPDAIYSVNGDPVSQVFLFPDAGCC